MPRAGAAARALSKSRAGAEAYRRAAMARRVAYGRCVIRTSLAASEWGEFALVARSLPGIPFDGHTLEAQRDKVVRLAGMMLERCHVDCAYNGQGMGSKGCRVIVAGSLKGISKAIKKETKLRAAIAPEVGHHKVGNWLGTNGRRACYVIPRTPPSVPQTTTREKSSLTSGEKISTSGFGSLLPSIHYLAFPAIWNPSREVKHHCSRTD